MMIQIDQGWIQAAVSMAALGLLAWRVLVRFEDRLSARIDGVERRLEKLEENQPMAMFTAFIQRMTPPGPPQVPQGGQ